MIFFFLAKFDQLAGSSTSRQEDETTLVRLYFNLNFVGRVGDFLFDLFSGFVLPVLSA